MDPLCTRSRVRIRNGQIEIGTWYRRPGFHLSQAQQKGVLRLDRCDLFSSAFGPAGAGGLLTSVAHANGQMRLMEGFENDQTQTRL